MKASTLFLSLFGIAIFSACSENELPTANDWESEKDGHFLAVEIVSPSSAMPRAGEPGDNDFEEGLGSPDENKVNSLRFYFFDALGNPISVNSTGYKYLDVTPIPEEDGKDAPNVEQKLKAVVVVKPTDKANVASMLAVANFDNSGLLDSRNYSREELAALDGDYSAVKKDDNPNFMMTSSTYANESGQVTRVMIDPSKHLCNSPEEAIKNPVAIYIERVVAKVRLKTAWRTTAASGKVQMEVRDITYNGNSYTAIKAKDKEGNVIKNNDQDVYILFTGWNVTGKANKSYLIKKVNSTTAWSGLTGLWFWNHPAYYRSYWAVNPNDVQLKYDNYTSINLGIGTTPTYSYCLENAADGEKGFSLGMKASYDPKTQKSNRTQVILAAILVTVNESNEATPISLAKWGYQDYTEEEVKTSMLNLVNHKIYVKEENEGGTTYRTIKLDEVRLVSALDAGKDVNNAEADERFLSYLNLTETATTNLKFYTDNTGTKELTSSQVNSILCDMPGAKVWRDGQTYYYTDIRHLGQNANNVGYGYYGVVRNHIYDISLNSVTGLGTPILNPDENVIPQKPEDDKDIFVAAQINILSWRIVKNDTDLEW